MSEGATELDIAKDITNAHLHWATNFRTEAYEAFCREHSTDYIIASANLAAHVGYLSMKQVEDFFLLLSGERREYYKRLFACDYIDGNIPIKFSWVDQCLQVIKPNEFLMVPSSDAGAVPESKFAYFDAEQQRHASIPVENLVRNEQAVPHCKGFAKWLKRWEDETTVEQWEYRVIRVSQWYIDYVRNSTPATSAQQNSVATETI